MRLARVLEFIGKTLIGAGILVLLFVVYQLWGTGIKEHRAQDKLQSQFTKLINPSSTTSTAPSNSTTPTTFPPGPPPPPPGDALARIRIPAIGVDKIVVQGVGVGDLQKGPGHYPRTPLPGQTGNAAIAGHRTTYGAPFNRLDELNNGDEILITTQQNPSPGFVYKVTEKKVVKPTDVSVLAQTKDDRLTLTTCNPKYSATTRLVIIASLEGDAAPASQPLPEDVIQKDEANNNNDVNNQIPDKTNTTQAPVVINGNKIDQSGKGAPKLPAILWGAGAALLFILILFIASRWRRWTTYSIGAPIFLVVLFFFFENLSRLLPSNF